MVSVINQKEGFEGLYYINKKDLHNFIDNLIEGIMDENGDIYRIRDNPLWIMIMIPKESCIMIPYSDVPKINYDTVVRG